MQHNEKLTPPARFAATSFLGLVTVLAAGVIFAVGLALVTSRWAPLQDLDAAVVDGLNEILQGHAWIVSFLRLVTNVGGSEAAWILIPAAAIWLIIRRRARLAMYVVVTGLGVAALGPGIKILIDRARPLVDVPLATAPGPSFPSGHALGSAVTYGVLVLVFLPTVPPRHRRTLVWAAVTLVAAIGLTRVALGVHYPSDVVGGWALGALWLGVTAGAFRQWHTEEGLGTARFGEGLEPESASDLLPAPNHDSPLPRGWTSTAQLLVGAVLISGVLAVVGLIITGPLRHAVVPLDEGVVNWFAGIRQDEFSPFLIALGRPGGTAGVVVVLTVAVTVALAVTRRWAPPAFLLVAAVGETTVFVIVATVVGRSRPPVAHLSEALPPTASFPSGHVAAATVTYGGIAMLFWSWGAVRFRGPVLAIAVVLPVSVALSRLYRGVHHPSDVLASFLFASAWLAVCWKVFKPYRGSDGDRTDIHQSSSGEERRPGQGDVRPGTARGEQ